MRKLIYIVFLLAATACGTPSNDLTMESASSPAEVASAYLAAAYPGKVVLRIDSADSEFESEEAFRICFEENEKGITITSPSEAGLLYGAGRLMAFHAVGKAGKAINIVENPAYQLRILNHWDNLDGTVERGYAGRSIWQWNLLPDSISPQIDEYGLKCALAGINGAVLNNVNASPKILTREYLLKAKAVADRLRKYGMRTFLSVNFASPMALDSLPTADPLEPATIEWWSRKADEIYSLIPDFGGFLVKANSEGQPGPCDFQRTHADGANMLARAIKKHGGIVMWRAFVYSPTDDDRAKQAYLEFKPLDGKFEDNVILQIKNGPIDFQPREPFSPLFGSMPHTDEMVEFQITQEYLGHSNHLVFLAPMWKEFFSSVDPASLKAMAGVANVGDSPGLTGHPFADANWYAFGRLAWNPGLSSEEIADEWLSMRLLKQNTPHEVHGALLGMMLESREATVDCMMPLGLHHIFAYGHHYGPEPWCDVPGARADWLPKYYHRADRNGLGFDRTHKGSDAVSQYPDSLASIFNDAETCPEKFLLWFHHLPWTHKMKSGRTLWQELCHAYQRGVDKVGSFSEIWKSAKDYVEPDIYTEVAAKLKTQARDARWWRDACLQYFAQCSGESLPEGFAPTAPLDSLMKVRIPITNFECPSDSLLNTLR